MLGSASGIPPYRLTATKPVLHVIHKRNVTMSHAHGWEVTNWSIKSRGAIHRLPQSTRPISLDAGLQVHRQTRRIPAF